MCRWWFGRGNDRGGSIMATKKESRDKTQAKAVPIKMVVTETKAAQKTTAKKPSLKKPTTIKKKLTSSTVAKKTTVKNTGTTAKPTIKNLPLTQNVFTAEYREDVCVVWIDDQNASTNTMHTGFAEELVGILGEVEQKPDLNGLIFISAKKDCFIAGANINMLDSIKSEEDAIETLELAHEIFNRIESLRLTTVAAINGACLGGGLELALACDKRIATEHRATSLGFPEVQLGVLPGGGGTQRTPALVGLERALDLLLTGKRLNTIRAYKAGLIDDYTAPDALLDAALRLAKKRAVSKRKGPASSIRNKLLAGNKFGRGFIFKQARKKVIKMTKGHYPAPLKIIDVVELGLSEGRNVGFKAEIKGFSELIMTPVSKQLMGIFFATTELKKDLGSSNKAVQPTTVTKIGVLGAGLMGAGIAAVTINKARIKTRLKDISSKGLEQGVQYIQKVLGSMLKRRRISALERTQILSRLSSTINYSGLSNCQVIIEAVFESLDLKQQMVADVEALSGSNPKSLTPTDKGIIFATNTSAIPIDDIASKAKFPENIVGMHYFSPVEKMPLLEIVKGSKTADWVTVTVAKLGRQQGKTVIIVNDGPGFYTTRILSPYANEAMRLISEGVPIEEVDKALTDFGFPVGPIALMDEVGLDVGAHISETLSAAFGQRHETLTKLNRILTAGRKGRKNQKGFYLYSDKKKAKNKQVDESIYGLLGVIPEPGKITAHLIVKRCVYAMLNEAAFCLDENILRSARDGDIGAIFGLGFPPYTGGPFRYIDSIGMDKFANELLEFSKTYGDRFEPCPRLTASIKGKVPSSYY
jgi:3-hydroxyacyl-CoA dehydrogenase/enoyl-CoA hydratase/3-hydroxybutyryl-CoA epimerase